MGQCRATKEQLIHNLNTLTQAHMARGDEVDRLSRENERLRANLVAAEHRVKDLPLLMGGQGNDCCGVDWIVCCALFSLGAISALSIFHLVR